MNMWSKERSAFVCSCHASNFDPRNAAEVIDGPAPRPLAALGLKLKDGVVTVASTFSGHVGVTQGSIVGRDGDIFGRTVNLAARISDVAPSGELYVPASAGQALAGRFVVTPAGTATLQGVGAIDLARVMRPGATID